MLERLHHRVTVNPLYSVQGLQVVVHYHLGVSELDKLISNRDFKNKDAITIR